MTKIENTDYDIQEFDLDDLVDALAENVKDDIKTFEDVINLDGAINREVYVGDICSGVGQTVEGYIRFWNKYDDKLSKTPVWTICTGAAYSGGFFTFIAGHRRFAYDHASFLYHEGATATGADAGKFRNYAEFYQKELEQLKEVTLKYTKITPEEYKEHIKDDWWMTAEEALKYGVCDEIAKEFV